MSKQEMTQGAVMLKVLTAVSGLAVNGVDSRLLAMHLGIETHRVEQALHDLMEFQWCCHDAKRDRYYPRAQLWAFAIVVDDGFMEADQKIGAQQLELMGFDPQAAIAARGQA